MSEDDLAMALLVFLVIVTGAITLSVTLLWFVGWLLGY